MKDFQRDIVLSSSNKSVKQVGLLYYNHCFIRRNLWHQLLCVSREAAMDSWVT